MRIFPTLRWLPRVAATLVLAIAAAACGDDDTDVESTPDATAELPAAPQDFAVRGPYAVGVIDLDVDPPILVYYPSDRSTVPDGAQPFEYTREDVWGPLAGVLPAEFGGDTEVPDAWEAIPGSTEGPFPLLVMGHGTTQSRFSYSRHSAHLASWGHIVAATQHPARDTVASAMGQQKPVAEVDRIPAAIAAVEAESARATSPLGGLVDMARVAAEGQGIGGSEAMVAAQRDLVDTWIGLTPNAPVPPEDAGGHNIVLEARHGFDVGAGEFDLDAYLAATQPPDVPAMMIVADNDMFYPVPDRRTVFDWLSSPKHFVVLADTGHWVFIDGCPTTQERGLADLWDALGMDPNAEEMRFVSDGCDPEDAPAQDVAAVWNHLVVAQLRWVFGPDEDVAAASLDSSYLEQAFPGRIAQYVANP